MIDGMVTGSQIHPWIILANMGIVLSSVYFWLGLIAFCVVVGVIRGIKARDEKERR